MERTIVTASKTYYSHRAVIRSLREMADIMERYNVEWKRQILVTPDGGFKLKIHYV